METITLTIGWNRLGNNGWLSEEREVAFEAEMLGEVKYKTDDRGFDHMDETLYRTPDSELIVYQYQSSQWQGSTTYMRLIKIGVDDLAPNGRFWRLGEESGFGRPLTLDEAMNLDAADELDEENIF